MNSPCAVIPHRPVEDDAACALAALAADAALPPATGWVYINASLAMFNGLPVARLYAVRQGGQWRPAAPERLPALLPRFLCACTT